MLSGKKVQKLCLLILLLAGSVSTVLGLYHRAPKWVESAGLIFDIAGIVQLEISGLFERILEKYGDVRRYPSGPPSHITRQIVDNLDAPMRTWFRNTFYFDRRAGFWLLVGGFFFQMFANWLA